jgi:plasmanylethanolamine desaturase
LVVKGRYGYSRFHRGLEIGGIGVFLSLLVYLSVRIGVTVTAPPQLLIVGACAGIGLLLADFASGLIHWIGDTVGDVTTPVIGQHFLHPFRNHHVDPKDITRHDFIETNGNNCIATVPVLGAMTPVLPDESGMVFYFCTVIVSWSWFVFATNQIHKWAHTDCPPRLARLLQRWGIILPPAHHQMHHAAPHDKYYCITVGWLNPLLTRLRFFRTLEAVVAHVRPRLLQLGERGQPNLAACVQNAGFSPFSPPLETKAACPRSTSSQK